MKKIRVFTAFSGYDSQCLALERVKRDFPDTFDYELVGWSEIDRCAINAHNTLFPKSVDKNFGDISKINWFEVPDFDLFTYSFPCQDISIGGFRKGLEEGTGTRSSLLWECRKTVEIKRPKYLLMENVDQILSKTHKKNFDKWCKVLEGYGYRNFYKMLNSMDYGVPQSRKRVFMVSILGDEWFDFPKEFKLKKCLLDIVEKDIPDDEYFSKETITEMFFQGNIQENSEIFLTNARHIAALHSAKESLIHVIDSIENQMPEDFLTIDLMDAYESLGKIIGEAVEEDLVNEIFSKFCMGK